ncbi:four helix bundle protein [Schinkia azotoformans]|uniref:four helix bundle protein n=1 Tax=Schinkia azotoformans TaxID=1454 RepID=UPI002DB811E7|nr:four helix bundle protein [Schinkia azotoformans]MEC1759889.1 four helix bundle protein [Schinkia azotoformans]
MPTKKEYVGNFRDLIAYQKALLFRKEIYEIVKTIPCSERFIMNELRKASCSICANLAEGNGNYYYGREFEHFDIALCKLVKCQSILDLVFSMGYVEEEKYNRLQDSAKEIARIIHALMNRIEGYCTSEVDLRKDCSNKITNVTNTETPIEEAKKFQKEIINMVRTLPEEESCNLVDQMNRAVSSIYENLIKSIGVISDRRFQELNYSIGSVSEVRSFLDICVTENFITIEEFCDFDEEADYVQTALIIEMQEITNQLKECL